MNQEQKAMYDQSGPDHSGPELLDGRPREEKLTVEAIPNAGGFTFTIRKSPDTDTRIVRIVAPRWGATSTITEAAAQDGRYVQMTVDYALEATVDGILKNPIVAAHVDVLVERARAEGFTAGVEKVRR